MTIADLNKSCFGPNQKPLSLVDVVEAFTAVAARAALR
jgi:hypothetical protein